MIPGNAFAEPRFSAHTTNPVNFSLSFSQNEIDLLHDDKTYSVNQRHISASIVSPVATNLFTNLSIGSSYIDLDSDPLTTAISLNGNHIGFGINGYLENIPQLAFRAHLLYQEARGSSALRSASLTWLEWYTAAILRINLGRLWRVGIEGGFMGIEAQRRVNGDINNKLILKRDAEFQGQISIVLNTDADGRVSLNLSRGVKTGTELSFSREF